MVCDVGVKFNDVYRKVSVVCWGCLDFGESRVVRVNDDDADVKSFIMNFDYVDNENGFDDGGYVGVEEFNFEMNVEEDGVEEEGGDMDWNVNFKFMFDYLTSVFDVFGDCLFLFNIFMVGKKRGEVVCMFY